MENDKIICANNAIKLWFDIREDEDSLNELLKEKLKNVNEVKSTKSLFDIINSKLEREYKTSISIPTEFGSKRSFEATFNNIEMEGRECKILIIKDLTEFEELTKERMNQKFQKILIASVTHEIRTPLNIQTGLLEMIEDPKNKGKESYYIEIAKRNLQLLTYLVNDIPDLSHSDPKGISLNISRFSVLQVLAECEELAKYQIQAKGLELKIDVSPETPEFIVSDKERYRRIALNVLLNSLKYTFHGGISIHLELRAPNYIETTIADTGIGMNQETISQLFKLDISDKKIENTANPQGRILNNF